MSDPAFTQTKGYQDALAAGLRNIAASAVGRAMIAAFLTDEYRATHDPMIAWHAVAQLIRSEPDDETAARLVQAVSECIKTDLRPGTAEAA